MTTTKERLAREVIAVRTRDGEILRVKGVKGTLAEQLDIARANIAAVAGSVGARPEEYAIILNDLPIDRALAMYADAAAQRDARA